VCLSYSLSYQNYRFLFCPKWPMTELVALASFSAGPCSLHSCIFWLRSKLLFGGRNITMKTYRIICKGNYLLFLNLLVQHEDWECEQEETSVRVQQGKIWRLNNKKNQVIDLQMSGPRAVALMKCQMISRSFLG
jgi:hypothetical protein